MTQKAPKKPAKMPKTDAAPRKKRKAIAKRPQNNVSRVTSGRSLFASGDGRSAWGRRFKDLLYLHCEDLGGIESLREFQLSLVRRVATMECELERMESELAEGKPVDVDAYARIASHLRRIVESLGLKRVVRDREPSLKEIVAKYARSEPAEAAGEPSAPSAARTDAPLRRSKQARRDAAIEGTPA